MVHFIGANKPWDSRYESKHTPSPFGEHVAAWWGVWDKHYVPQPAGNAHLAAPYKTQNYQQTIHGRKVGPVFSRHQYGATATPVQWTPPPVVGAQIPKSEAIPVIGAQIQNSEALKAQVGVTELEKDRAETPRPNVTQTPPEGAETPRPARPVVTIGIQTLKISDEQGNYHEIEQLHDLPSSFKARVVQRIFHDSPELRQKIEYPKTSEASSVHASHVDPPLMQSTAHTVSRHVVPFTIQEPVPVRPTTPVRQISLPEFDEYRTYQPTFLVAGTVYIHRPDSMYHDDDVHAYPEHFDYSVPSAPAVGGGGYVEPFRAPKSEWDPSK